MLHVFDDFALTTRERTPEGFLRGRATVTKVGILEYDAAELGLGEAGDVIRVRQTPDSVFHDDTMRSIQNAPVTIGHPQGNVSPATWSQLSVGSVGTPEKIGEEHVGVDILFGDATAIAMVEGGVQELSIGKRFNLQPAEDADAADYVTVGPIGVNHVAVVEKGRAGPDVRVMDTARRRVVDTDPNNAPPSEIDSMDVATLTAAIKAALPATTTAGDTNTIVAAVVDGLKPLTDRMDAADRARVEAQRKEAADELKQKFDKAVDDARNEGIAHGERVGAMRADALMFVAPDQQAAFAGKPVKEVLVAAVADMHPGAAAFDEATLHGLLMAKKNMAMGGYGMPANPGMTPGGGFAPFGTVPFQQHQATAGDVQAQRKQAYADAVDARLGLNTGQPVDTSGAA